MFIKNEKIKMDNIISKVENALFFFILSPSFLR